MNSPSWQVIFDKYDIENHNFKKEPYIITAKNIKEATKHFKKTSEKEVRILCKQDSRKDRPDIFKEKGLFILPIKNGLYAIVKGEGYVDIPEIKDKIVVYKSKLNFKLETGNIGSSEMQHLDFAYASSLVRTFTEDDSLVLTIRGRKYTPKFSFNVGSQKIEVEGVQTEVDAGYEGENKVVLIEAKNSITSNVIIRQLYYPYRQWDENINQKKVIKTLFFEKRDSNYLFWEFAFKNKNDYNSIYLLKSKIYEIK